MSAETIGDRVGGVLQHVACMFGTTRPVALAGRLLDERVLGMVPVWPTTERMGDRLVEGLEELLGTRGPEVLAAIADAPADTPLNWHGRLAPLTR